MVEHSGECPLREMWSINYAVVTTPARHGFVKLFVVRTWCGTFMETQRHWNGTVHWRDKNRQWKESWGFHLYLRDVVLDEFVGIEVILVVKVLGHVHHQIRHGEQHIDPGQANDSWKRIKNNDGARIPLQLASSFVHFSIKRDVQGHMGTE